MEVEMRLVGIDLGVHKIALAFFVDDHLVNGYVHHAAGDLSRDLQLRDLAGYARQMVSLHDAHSVWIEEVIIGNNRRYSLNLAEVKGAVLSELAALRLQSGTDVRTVDNQTWKKQVVGRGNASKAEVRDYIHVTHSAYAPLCGDDQDLYDAACVGLYGHLVMDRAEHLQL